jgi:16S rRNA (guanine527-N7)-methyltransferase
MALSALGPGWEPLVQRALNELWPGAPFEAGGGMERLLDLVCEWNARIDLTAAQSNEELVDLFVADAAVLARHSAQDGSQPASWVDVGAGAGAPGLPLALFSRGLTMTLVEPRAKRVAFLRTALGALQRLDVRIVRDRSERLQTGSFDVAVSRATLGPDAWLREGARLARSGVWVLVARSAPPALAGWRLESDVAYRWPLTNVERRALLYVPEPHA